MAIAKRWGVKLGMTGKEVLAPLYRAQARERAQELAPVIRQLQEQGYSMRGIAGELMKRKWQHRAVAHGIRNLSAELCAA